jgi:hypothetical protein
MEGRHAGAAEFASERQDVDNYERRIAAEVVAMVRDTEVDARRVLAYVDAILNLELPGEEPPAASAQIPA